MKYSIINKECKIYIFFSKPDIALRLIQSLESVDGVKWTGEQVADENVLIISRQPYVTLLEIRTCVECCFKSNGYAFEYVEAYS